MNRYAAKAVFEIKTTFPNRKRNRTFYEVRILNVTARSERSALRKMKRLCEDDQFFARLTARENLQQKFMTLIAFDDVGVLNSHEVWYEYVDERPRAGRSRIKVPKEFRGSARPVPWP